MENFSVQLKRQRELIEDSRRRLYELELQLRQYEVGRNILLSQLAAAEKVEQQYAIARQFDPFNAVANWQRAEGLVQQKSLNAKAIERVYADTTDVANAAALSSGVVVGRPGGAGGRAGPVARPGPRRRRQRRRAERAIGNGAARNVADPQRQIAGPSEPPAAERSSVIHLDRPH